MEEYVRMVCGRRIERVSAAALSVLARQYERVTVDLGTGGGRWLYRLARATPDLFCLGIDANAEVMREVSFRAARKPARGGVPNIRFIAAAAESLPAGLRGLADEVYVAYPWGSLLWVVLAPDPQTLGRVADLLKPGGVFRVAVNESVLADTAALARVGLRPRAPHELYARIVAGYNEAGLKVTGRRLGGEAVRSSWAGRLGQGSRPQTLWVEAVRDGDGRDHGRR